MYGTYVSSQLRIPHFDLIRTIAITSVVVSHIFNEENSYLEGRYPLWSSSAFQILRAPITTGGYGVALFLLLSGVLISRVVAQESMIAFAVRRFLRIWPLYTVMIVAHFTYLSVTQFPGSKIRLSEAIGIFTLLGDFWNAPLYLGFVDWSLRVEVVAYCLVVAAAVLGGPRNRAFVMTTAAVVVSFAPPIPSGLFSSGYLNIHLPLFVAGFCFGAMVQGENGGGIRKLSQVLVLVNIALVFIAASTHRSDLSDSIYFNANIVAAVTTFFLIIRFQPHTTGSIIRKTSESSYGLYLMHNWLVYVLAEQLFGNTGLLARVTGLVMVVILARLLFVYFEAPIIRFSKRITTQLTKSSTWST